MAICPNRFAILPIISCNENKVVFNKQNINLLGFTLCFIWRSVFRVINNRSQNGTVFFWYIWFYHLNT